MLFSSQFYAIDSSKIRFEIQICIIYLTSKIFHKIQSHEKKTYSLHSLYKMIYYALRKRIYIADI